LRKGAGWDFFAASWMKGRTDAIENEDISEHGIAG
jgi:hypothetical protein